LQCDLCGNPLMVSDSTLTSPLDSTEVYSELTMVCINPKCGNYCGKELNKPKKIAKKMKNKVN